MVLADRAGAGQASEATLEDVAMHASGAPLRRRLTAVGGTSIETNEIVPLATCRPSGFVFRGPSAVDRLPA